MQINVKKKKKKPTWPLKSTSSHSPLSLHHTGLRLQRSLNEIRRESLLWPWIARYLFKPHCTGLELQRTLNEIRVAWLVYAVECMVFLPAE